MISTEAGSPIILLTLLRGLPVLFDFRARSGETARTRGAAFPFRRPGKDS